MILVFPQIFFDLLLSIKSFDVLILGLDIVISSI